MPLEIERRFRVRDDGWRGAWPRQRYCQGYLARNDRASVRVRRAGARAFLTVKSVTRGLVRQEYEYEIPVAHADAMLAGLCVTPLVDKIRHRVPHGGRVWLVDEFNGANAGLVLAEIELAQPHEPVAYPPWLGDEVTGDPRFRNSSLARHPFGRWRDAA
jgi:CYTH domain-containing protein